MSIHDRDLLTGKTKLETTIERIKTFCTGKRVLVEFSGGKDSQCCYHLCKDAGIDFEAQYYITRFEPPELIAFIRKHYPDVTFLRAYKKSLVEQIADIGLPNRWRRWCCEAKHRKTQGFDICVIGVRWQESARRRMRWTMFGHKKDGFAYVCPICDWTHSDVWEYLNGKRLPHCRLKAKSSTARAVRARRIKTMNNKTKKKSITDWEWTTLVAAWRYYEHRHSINSAMFPHEIVTRFFTGDYDDESCKRIANQFVEIDHNNGPDDKISGWVGDGTFGDCDRRAWRLFYSYLYAYLYGFKTAKVTLDGKSGLVEVFRADGKWYAREGYERFGENVAPYKDSEIEFSYCVCQIVRR